MSRHSRHLTALPAAPITGHEGGHALRYELPYAAAGQSVGLLGGSFDPPHDGHVHITREALKPLSALTGCGGWSAPATR
jgi:hypothetical protein